jgi:Family of unknown function (DUF5681)
MEIEGRYVDLTVRRWQQLTGERAYKLAVVSALMSTFSRRCLVTDEEYEAGFGKPPKSTQFSKVKSGNPNGRPKGSKNLATVFREIAQEQVNVTEGGRKRTTNKSHAVMVQLTNKAVSGERWAIQTYLQTDRTYSLSEVPEEIPRELTQKNKEVMNGFINRMKLMSKAVEDESSPTSPERRRGNQMSTNLAVSDFDFVMRHSLMAFTEYTFRELFPQTLFSDSPHLSILAAKLEECASGKCKRLIICLPPRSLKSTMTSVAFPAWLLGKLPAPTTRLCQLRTKPRR